VNEREEGSRTKHFMSHSSRSIDVFEPSVTHETTDDSLTHSLTHLRTSGQKMHLIGFRFTTFHSTTTYFSSSYGRTVNIESIENRKKVAVEGRPW
jgi:hypothetical protein